MVFQTYVEIKQVHESPFHDLIRFLKVGIELAALYLFGSEFQIILAFN